MSQADYSIVMMLVIGTVFVIFYQAHNFANCYVTKGSTIMLLKLPDFRLKNDKRCLWFQHFIMIKTLLKICGYPNVSEKL